MLARPAGRGVAQGPHLRAIEAFVGDDRGRTPRLSDDEVRRPLTTRQPAERARLQAVDVEPVRGLGRSRRVEGAARVLQVGGDAALLVDREDVPVRLAE